MLLLMIERGLPIDMVLTADTGMEFPEMYHHWDRIEQYLFQKRGLKLTIAPGGKTVPCWVYRPTATAGRA